MSYPGAARRGASASRSDGAADRTFPRTSRLCARKLFLEVYERGQRVNGTYFVVFGLPGATARSRLGITATKKFGDSVTRNRIKRVVREMFRRSRREGEVPIDLVVNVKAAARGQAYERLEADWLERMRELRRKLRA